MRVRITPEFSLKGQGTVVCETPEEIIEAIQKGLILSPNGVLRLEELTQRMCPSCKSAQDFKDRDDEGMWETCQTCKRTFAYGERIALCHRLVENQ